LLYARLALVAAVRNKEGERQRLALHVVANSFAHELKQPLTAILGNAEAMQQALARGAPDPSQARELIADIVSESLRADNIITATRSMLKGAERPAESVRIDQLVSESLAVLRTDSGMQCVSIQMEVPADLPAVKGNKGQLMQVLINLISNALDAMQEVTDRPRVLSIRSSVLEGAMIALIVGDSGRGIEPQNMPRIFEPFFTTSPRGTGIGLAICRLIIEAHGGRISASSARESGSTFEICLPIA
jgi:signal transduction histidine kinase